MYKEFLGEGYHDAIRTLLQANKDLLPDRIIDADLNIGGMRKTIGERLKKAELKAGPIPRTGEIFKVLQEASRQLLAAVLCSALRSRTAVPPFVEYQRNWIKKQTKFVERYEKGMQEIERRVREGRLH
jgi:hypothetical protein